MGLPLEFPSWLHYRFPGFLQEEKVVFAGDGSGFYWCIDLAPASGGTWGQIIAWDHEEGPADLLFPSFEALLSTCADQLEAGLHPGFSTIFPLKK